MKQTMSVLLIAILLNSCAMMLTEATKPEVRQVTVATPLNVTYERAVRAATKMGAVITEQDPAQYTFTAHHKGVIALHVDVRRLETGTQMTVTGSILPKQAAIGIMTEVDEFLVAYRKEAL